MVGPDFRHPNQPQMLNSMMMMPSQWQPARPQQLTSYAHLPRQNLSPPRPTNVQAASSNSQFLASLPPQEFSSPPRQAHGTLFGPNVPHQSIVRPVPYGYRNVMVSGLPYGNGSHVSPQHVSAAVPAIDPNIYGQNVQGIPLNYDEGQWIKSHSNIAPNVDIPGVQFMAGGNPAQCNLSYGDQLLADSIARRGTPQLIADVSVNAAVGNHMNRYQTHEIAQMAANAAQNENNLNRLLMANRHQSGSPVYTYSQQNEINPAQLQITDCLSSSNTRHVDDDSFLPTSLDGQNDNSASALSKNTTFEEVCRFQRPDEDSGTVSKAFLNSENMSTTTKKYIPTEAKPKGKSGGRRTSGTGNTRQGYPEKRYTKSKDKGQKYTKGNDAQSPILYDRNVWTPKDNEVEYLQTIIRPKKGDIDGSPKRKICGRAITASKQQTAGIIARIFQMYMFMKFV